MQNKAKEGKRIKDELNELGIDMIIDTKVTKFGTSGHIPISKKFIGRKVSIIVLKE
jgi:putative transposon-encoded protein